MDITTRAVTREEVREIDRKAIEEYGIPGVVLMENAGRRVAEEALKMLRKPAESRVAVLCGKGNNGGDGFVAARHLYNQGVKVDVYTLARVSDIAFSLDAFTHLKILINMGLEIKELCTDQEVKKILPGLEDYDLLIDGLLGTGLTGEVRGPYRMIIEGMNASGVPILAIDIPSGLDCNDGKVLGAAIKATRTVTFVLPKKGFFLGEGPKHVGELITADIGVPRELVEGLGG